MHWTTPCGAVTIGLLVGGSLWMLSESPPNALELERPVLTTVHRAETLHEALTACGEVSAERDAVRDRREAAYQATWPDWLPRCATEDSQGPCVWIADERGPDHGGESFVVTEGGHVEYVTHDAAREVVQQHVIES